MCFDRAGVQTVLQSMRKSLPVVIFLILTALGVAAYLFYSKSLSNSQKANFTDISGKRSYWEEKIRTMGAQKAYDLFKKKNNQNHPGVQHYVAHVFGEALYNIEGSGGIAVCDSTFSYGCFHSFFSEAIADEADELMKIAQDFNEECIKKYGPLGLGCQHGIGHGIMQYLGPSRLDEALEVCLKIQTLAYRGCSMGVFMEHFLATIIEGEKVFTIKRDLDKNNPFYPCEEIKQQFKKSCYFQLGQWLVRVPGLGVQSKGKLCHAIKNREHKQSCFLGLGLMIAAITEFDKDLGLGKCKEMPDIDGQIFCVAGLSSGFYVNNKAAQFQDICSTLSDDKKQICTDKADITKVKMEI